MSKLKGLWIPSNILLNKELSDKEKMILAIILYLSEENNYLDSQKQPYHMGKNKKDIINNIKIIIIRKHLGKRITRITLNSEIILTLTLLNYMQMQMHLYR